MSGKHLQAVRGMGDILPQQAPYWQYLESQLRQLINSYGYDEIRLPIVEQTALFSRSIGEVTDIVEKEMYTFDDRNGDSLTLRPEGTAGCVRAGIQHGLLYNQQQRLWYMGPMFRHERPQKGRYRQFYQFGVEAFGLPGPDIEAEHIVMMARLWQQLGISDVVTLQLNSLGDLACREAYKKALVAYFTPFMSTLDEECQARLAKNPLRLLDSKNPDVQALFPGAPVMTDFLDDTSRAHFDRLQELLTALGVKFELNPHIVRGLDYYGMTIYEWVTDRLGSQGTICAGGRFDRLVGMLGGKESPAVGFSMGLERVICLIEASYTPASNPDVYFIMVGPAAETQGLVIAESLRDQHPELKILVNGGGGSLKSQFKRSDKSGAKVALVLGDDELEMGKIAIKFLREHREQQQVDLSELGPTLLQAIAE